MCIYITQNIILKDNRCRFVSVFWHVKIGHDWIGTRTSTDFKFFCCSFDLIQLFLVLEVFHAKIVRDPWNLQNGYLDYLVDSEKMYLYSIFDINFKDLKLKNIYYTHRKFRQYKDLKITLFFILDDECARQPSIARLFSFRGRSIGQTILRWYIYCCMSICCEISVKF